MKDYWKVTQRGLDILKYPDLMNDDGSLKRFYDLRMWWRKLINYPTTNTEASKMADSYLEDYYKKNPHDRPK